jgi:hypothetical protein
MSEVYRMNQKPGEHTGVYYGRSQKGMERKGNSEKKPEAYGSI